jgi:hypothetical protein
MADEPKLIKVQFVRDYTVQADRGQTYEEGQVVQLPEASANHFLARGAAELVDVDKGRAAKK